MNASWPLWPLVLLWAHAYLSSEWQREAEGGSCSLFAFHPDPASMAFDQACRYCQSQTEAWGSVTWSLNPVKRLKHVCLEIFGDAGAKILHTGVYCLCIGCQFDQNRL